MNYLLNEGYEDNIKVEKGVKSKIYIKGKAYEDLSYCAGTLLLGHNSNVYKKTLKKLSAKNISNFAMPNIYAENLSKLLYKKFNKYFDKFIFCNSGSESVMKALRIAKAVSKKDLIVSVTGSWHGSLDQFLFYPNKFLKPENTCNGISNFYKNNLKFIPYNDIKNTKIILDRIKSKIAAIIIEPVQACLPMESSKEYLFFLQKYCDQNNIILIFDEMITGIRTYEGSVHKKFQLSPSISTFGKCIGGGAPIGVIALSKKFTARITKLKKKVYFGGTFSGNSLSTFIGYETLNYLNKNRSIIKNLNKNTEYVKKEISDFIEKNKIKVKLYSFQSMLRIVFTRQKIKNRYQRDFFEKNNISKVVKFKNFLFKNKIYYPSNGILFLSNETKIKSRKLIISKINEGLYKFFR
jgi:glutamate-1-semialdehyde 2,1-aminomutase